jgi:hypothetical protein
MSLVTLASKEHFPYRGPELRPHFLLERFQVRGSALVSWRGPCQVLTQDLVDHEDRLENESIEAKEMVHFLGEFFGMSLSEGVLRQRLWIARIAESLGAQVRCLGNDLMVGERKLSVSIVTASPVSILLHFGINIDPTGAPVAAIGLRELKVDADEFALRALGLFSDEWQQVLWACAKVRPVV